MFSRSPLAVLLPALLLSACSLPLYSESELESESGQQLPAALKLYNTAQAAGRKPNCQR